MDLTNCHSRIKPQPCNDENALAATSWFHQEQAMAVATTNMDQPPRLFRATRLWVWRGVNPSGLSESLDRGVVVRRGRGVCQSVES